jgi:hypothetical protein
MASISVVFNEHVARIKRVAEQEFSGCSAIFDPSAWPFCRFHIQNPQGTKISRARSFSLAELASLSDQKLREVMRRLPSIAG